MEAIGWLGVIWKMRHGGWVFFLVLVFLFLPIIAVPLAIFLVLWVLPLPNRPAARYFFPERHRQIERGREKENFTGPHVRSRLAAAAAGASR